MPSSTTTDSRLTFEFLNGEDEATRDEIIASVLATVDFRELTG